MPSDAPPGAPAARATTARADAPGRPRWGRRIGLTVLLLVVLARRLERRRATSRSGAASRTRTRGCRRRSRRASRRRTALLALEAVADPAARHRRRQTAARADARRSDSILLVRTDPGRQPARVPLDPARPARRHPRLRAEQDQRRLPARRARADDADRSRAHRPAAEPRRDRRLRRLPQRHRRARRGRDRRAEADPLEPLRLPVRDRGALPAVAGLALRARASRR